MIANKKARLIRDALEARRTIESKWNQRLEVGLRMHYSRSSCLKHQKSAPSVDALWRPVCELHQGNNHFGVGLRRQYNKKPPD